MLSGEDVRFDDVQRRVFEEHCGHQRMTVLGEGGGDDGAERVADDDGWFADHLKEPVGVGDVVVEVVAAGGAVGASVAAQVEGVAVPPRSGALDDGHPARAVGGQAVQQDEGRAVVVAGFVVGDGGSAAGRGHAAGCRSRRHSCEAGRGDGVDVVMVGAAAAAEHAQVRVTVTQLPVLVGQVAGVAAVQLGGGVELGVAQRRGVGPDATDPRRPRRVGIEDARRSGSGGRS